MDDDLSALIARASGRLERSTPLTAESMDELERGLAEAFAASVSLTDIINQGRPMSVTIARSTEQLLQRTLAAFRPLHQAELDVMEHLMVTDDPASLEREGADGVRRLRHLASRAISSLHHALAAGYESIE